MGLMKYTTVTSISNRLQYRLQVGGIQQPYGSPLVEPALLDQVGAQVEANVDAALSQVYTLPLNLNSDDTKAQMASLIEKGVICEVYPVHYSVDGSSDQFGKTMCQQYQEQLAAIVSGQIPLRGEISAVTPTLTISPPQTFVSSRKSSGRKGDALDIKW